MVRDRDGALPSVLWKEDEVRKAERDMAEDWLREDDEEKLANSTLSGDMWIGMLCGKKGTFTAADLIPLRQSEEDSQGKTEKPTRNTEENTEKNTEGDMEGEREKNTMEELAKEAGKLGQDAENAPLHPGTKKRARAYRTLILDLGRAATECSELKTCIRISLFLFLAVANLYLTVKLHGSKERKGLRDIGRKLLRNYGTLALISGSLPPVGDA